MERNWLIVTEKAENRTESAEHTIRLEIAEANGNMGTVIIGKCTSLDEFTRHIASIKDELDQLASEAEARWNELRFPAESEVAQLGPDEIWSELEAAGSEQDMFDTFNSLNEVLRAGVAEYVFTHVSMFKGKGPLFAEHYNAESHALE